MSLIRRHKHDVTWDSDIADECQRCEEVMVDAASLSNSTAIGLNADKEKESK